MIFKLLDFINKIVKIILFYSFIKISFIFKKIQYIDIKFTFNIK